MDPGFEDTENHQGLTLRGHRPNPARVYLASLAPRGRAGVGYQLRQVARILTGRDDIDAVAWHAIDRQAVIGILETLRLRGLAIATINHCLSVLKRVAEESWADGQMSVDTYLQVCKVRAMSGSSLPAGRAPSREEVRRAVEAARAGTTLRDLRDAALIATTAGAGLRCMEILGLTSDDYRDGKLKLTGKGGKQAWQPVGPTARAVLEEYQDALPTPTGPLFVRWRRFDAPGKEGLSQAGVRHILLRWFDDLSPHDLRRAYATWLAQDGVSLPVIQRLMRHANPQTTMGYIRNEDEQLSASENLRF